MTMEIIPLGTLLTIITTQVIKTAQAAKDVVFEKESFKVLSTHLFDIEPVLKELQQQKLNESPVARQALEFLESDVKKANTMVEKYKNRSRFYLLVRCRYIVKEVQDVTRDIGRSLAALSLANTEVLSGISDQVNKIQNEMQGAEFESSQLHLQIVDKLSQGLKDQKLDQGFANDILKEIARAVGVADEHDEISKELNSFRREKEEAEERKERAEVFFLEQVIELLSRADAARDYEEMRKQYLQRLQGIKGYDAKDEYIEPYKPFLCCISKVVMDDPVCLHTGTACERSVLENWFNCGNTTDPASSEPLEDFSYRSNLHLRRSIQEWKELNYCLKIRSCKAKLESNVDSSIEDALEQMQELIKQNSINKYWVSFGGITEIIISILGTSQNKNVKMKILTTLKDVAEGHARNKDLLVENKGFEYIIPCIEYETRISQAAVELTYELLRDRSGWNACYCRELARQSTAIPLLVAVRETNEKAVELLMKLFDEDDNNIIEAAKTGWYTPLIDRITQGSASTRISMVQALINLELSEQKTKILGEEGLVPTLLEMANGNLESKEISLSMLAKLSNSHQNKHRIASANGVPHILKLMFNASHMQTMIIAKCSEILNKLSSNGDGVKFLVDENGTQINLESIITFLLALHQNPNSSHIFRRPALHALLGICQSDARLIKTAVLNANGVSLILPLLDDSDIVVREASINLLFLFSQHEPQGVVEYLLMPRRLEALVGLLENNEKGDVQMAAAGLLANLPKAEKILTQRLIEVDGLKAIIDILKSGTMEAKENALSALFRFTDPTNLESQRIVVELGTFGLLVDFLKTGSVTAKARAAALIGDLSMRSPELTMATENVGCWCLIRRTHAHKCPAHGTICSVSSTFCLLEANALPELVELVKGEVHATAYEAIQTLSTLVREECPSKGSNVLHEKGAIVPLLEVLRWGSESLKEEALELLEKIFMCREMVDLYGSRARLPLVQLTGRSILEDGRLQRKAARVLLLIERYSRSSSSFFNGISG